MLRLLASTITVETIATVPSNRAASAAASITFEKLNNALASSGISVGAVSDKTVIPAEMLSTKDPAPHQFYDSASTLTILVVCSMTAFGLCCALGIYKTGRCCNIDNINTTENTRQLVYVRGNSLSTGQSSLQVAGFVEKMQTQANVQRSFDERTGPYNSHDRHV